MPPISKDQARDLARAFLNLSHTLGQYRFDHWDELGADRRKAVEDLEWSLQNTSSDLTTHAVGIALDDMDGDLKAIQAATDEAKTIVASIQGVTSLLTIATKALALGGAFIAQNPSAVAEAVGGLFEAVKNAQRT